MKDFETKIEDRIERRYSPEQVQEWRRRHQRGRIWTGVFLLLIGAAAMLRYTLPVPDWMFSWQMLLIALGVFLSFRNGFRSGPGLILILIGGLNMLYSFFPEMIDRRMIWPMVLMAVGLFLIFKPRRRHRTVPEPATATPQSDSLLYLDESTGTNEDVLECTSIFGGLKKNIFSKNFKGGEVVNILGGTDLNLSQADIQGTVILDVTQVFGGTKIIVPPHWDVKPEMAAIFAGIEDKRHLQQTTTDRSKVLLIKGTTVFGGIEVKSF